LIGLDAFADRSALEPLAVVLSTVLPCLNTEALWLAITPFTIVNLFIWELTLAEEEQGLVPISFEERAIG